ncbi:MAG: hypothetical protein ACI837_000995 [Crocinitomicaceae bacterium]|jgi:hypothetical protein
MIAISNDSFVASTENNGILIREKRKGPLKMVLIFLGLSILAIILSLVLAKNGGAFGVIIAPFLFWGAILIAGISLVALILKVVIKIDPTILFNTETKELHIRGKIIPFQDISDVNCQLQNLMGKTAAVVFIVVNGKKKSLFSTSVMTKDPESIEELADALSTLVEG